MTHPLSTRCVRLAEAVLRRSPVPPPIIWRVMRFVHNRLQYEIDDYEVPTDPLAVFWVDPDDITMITGREWRPWTDRHSLIGNVRGGDWDRTSISNAPDYCSPYPREYDTYFFYESARAHFEDGVPWDETEVYSIRREKGYSHDAALANLSRIDELFGIIQSEGYRTQRDLYLDGSGRHTVLGALLNEILVDISRDGRFLFVDGRHRLSIAKVLGVDTVPVFVLVRHESWMEKREQHYRETGEALSPPDSITERLDSVRNSNGDPSQSKVHHQYIG